MIGTQNAVLTEETENTPQTNIYPELRQLIKEQGLLNRQPLYYTYKIISTLSLLALSITFLVIVDNPWLQLANAAFLAFVYSQSGYVGHDAGHRAVLRSLRGNEIIGLSVSFLLGMSRTWWVRQHNQHHSSPNDLKSDPHTMLSPFSFSQELALSRSRLMRFAVGYQAFYFVPTLLLEGMAIRLASFQYLWARRNTKYARIEFFLMGLHFHLYFGLLFYFLDPWQVLGFFLIHQGLFGLYYGTVFAPNHKGMLILDNEKPLDFLRTQVLTTRNVKPGPIADFWYGGLNYQIEHHLFPMMPRNNFGKARKIIKAFCLKYNVPYYETSTLRSYREILSYLHQVGAPVRSWPRLKKQLEPGQ